MLILIRVLQGLALGGEYGGAAVYVAEHVPDGRRGYHSSFIPITATLGFFISLVVILAIQYSFEVAYGVDAGKAAFASWGWRIPFLLSVLLVGMSLYIRLRMKEAPIFSTLKKEGKTSSTPLKHSLGNRANGKRILISLFGATAGQGVVWYTGQFYALFYLQTVLRINPRTANIVVAIALLLGMPFLCSSARCRIGLAAKRL